MFPKKAISSVIGLGTMAGSFGAILFPMFIGAVLDHFKLLGKLTAGYNIIFVVCSCAYVVAWLVMHLLAPQMKKVEVAAE
jgi:ACS family hexuronate transporter-like MFS transporter